MMAPKPTYLAMLPRDNFSSAPFFLMAALVGMKVRAGAWVYFFTWLLLTARI